MIFSSILFIIALLSFIYHFNNLILLIINLEIMFISIAFIFILSSLQFNDIFGLIISIFIILRSGIETAIFLTFVVSYYRIRLSLSLF